MNCSQNWWRRLRSRFLPATKSDLETLHQLILMKASEIDAKVSQVLAHVKEAHTEIVAKIEELSQANADPNVGNEEFTAKFAELEELASKLKDVVPNADPVE